MTKQDRTRPDEKTSRQAEKPRPDSPRVTQCPETQLMFCPACGFPLTDLDFDDRCIQCGRRACPSCTD